MNPFGFAESLEDAPNSYKQPGIEEWLSYNGQLFLRCSKCERAMWCSPLHLEGDKEQKIRKIKCDRCGKRALQLSRFTHILEAMCGVCNTMAEFDSRKPEACKGCGSRNFMVLGVQEYPPYPALFGTAFEKKDEDWCVSVHDDLNHLHDTVRSFRQGPFFHANCVHLIQFFKDLFNRGEYKESTDLKSEFINAAAQLLRQLFRETGNIHLGIRSVEMMEDATKLVSDDLSVALYSHNVATHFYGMLAKGMESVADALMQRETRPEALQYAKRALELYSGCDGLSDNQRSTKCAEVEWLIGDIVGADDPGDPALIESISWYDRGLKRSGLGDGLIANILDARKSKIRKMKSSLSVPALPSLSSGTAPDDLNSERDFHKTEFMETSKRDFMESVQSREDEAENAIEEEDYQKAATILSDNYAFIRYQLCSSARDTIIKNFGTAMMRSVGKFSKFLADAHSPTSGLAILEDFRSFAIWEASSIDEIAKKSAKIALKAKLAELLGGKAPYSFDEDDLEEAVLQLTDSFQTLSKDRQSYPKIILFELNSYSSFCAVCSYDNAVISVSDFVELDSTNFSDMLPWMSALMLANDPNLMRTSKVERLLRIAHRCFGAQLESIWGRSDESVILISSSFLIPFEALACLNNPGLPAKPIRYAPSIKIAAAMVKGRALKVRSVLAIGYRGDDLPGVAHELNLIRQSFTGQVTILSGSELKRKAVLDAIASKPYDIIHFACHGQYDATDPLDSSLLLDNTIRSEEDRITARDFLKLTALQSRPLIVLSACSSSVISNNASNNYLGLLGAFLRVGVSGILGTRWPVSDRVALEYMGLFYGFINQGVPPAEAASNAQNKLKTTNRLDDWLSFLYTGA